MTSNRHAAVLPLRSIDELRSLMPVTEKWTYLDHAAVSPIPAPVSEAMRDCIDDVMRNGVLSWTYWRNEIETARRLAAKLLAVDEMEVAITSNTTSGIGIVAEGFPWKNGDNVVTANDEFPSNLYPWMNLKSRGVECRIVEHDEDDVESLYRAIESACDAGTKIVALSWVSYRNGMRRDPERLAGIAHHKGALLFLDAIQGLGVFPMEPAAAGVDFLAAGAHKWLLGPQGCGVAYIATEHLDKLSVHSPGWNSVAHAGDFANHELRFKPTAGRFEPGTYPMAVTGGLSAVLQLLSEIPPVTRAARVLSLTDALASELNVLGVTVQRNHDPGHQSGIVSVPRPNHDLRQLMRSMREEGIVVTARHGCIRLAPHLYNTEDEVLRAAKVLFEQSIRTT